MTMDSASSRALQAVQADPIISSELYDQLQAEGYPRSATKTAVSRLVRGGRILRSSLSLGSGNSILSAKAPVADPDLLRRLYDNAFFGRPGLTNLVDCLRTSHPIVNRFDAAKLTGVEIGNTTTGEPNWQELDKAMNGLCELEIITQYAPGGDTHWVLNRKLSVKAGLNVGIAELSSGRMEIFSKLKYTLVKAVAEWLRQNALVSDSGTKVATATKHVSYLGLPFDVLGFSFLAGVANRRGETVIPAVLVGDCLVEECNLPYAKSFWNRVEQCKNKARRQPISFILCRSFTHDAFKYLRSLGVAAWTQSQLLSQKTADAIEKTLSIAQSIVQLQKLDPNAFTEAFEGFDVHAGLFGDLKGKLFELMMAHFSSAHFGDSQLAWRAEVEDEKYDVDVLAIRSPESWAIECKGIKADGVVEHSEIKKHFMRRVPVVRRMLFSDKVLKVRSITGLVVTTGNFEDQSASALSSGVYGSRPSTHFELWDRNRLLIKLREAEMPELCSIMERFYR